MVSSERRRKRPVETLKQRADFNNIRVRGRSLSVNSWMLLRTCANSDGRLRIGFTFPRYVGPAVVRNRIRRWCREFFREYQSQEKPDSGLDINVILKKRDKDFYDELSHDEITKALGRAMPLLRGRRG